jgi:hypothetical protein
MIADVLPSLFECSREMDLENGVFQCFPNTCYHVSEKIYRTPVTWSMQFPVTIFRQSLRRLNVIC